MKDEVNMRRYGGIGKFMPITALTFGLGYLAIIGVPPFAGFYSKDKIIETAFNAGGSKGLILGITTLLGAMITAFYMTRVVVLTFFGNERWGHKDEPAESPPLMLIPIGLLSVGSVVSGFFLARGEALVHWLEPVVNPLKEHHSEEFLSPIIVSLLTLTAVIIGISIAVNKYRSAQADLAPEKVFILTTAARKDLFQDSINEAAFMRPGQSLVGRLLKIDYLVIDGLVRAVGGVSLTAGDKLRTLQNGYVRSYALMMVIGALALIAVIWSVTA